MQNDFWGTRLTDSGSHGSYRPLCVLSFKLNHLFDGYKPYSYHLVNVLLHCLATSLVVKVARHVLQSIWGTIVTGALFASHPIHTEAVAGIVGRADLASCNFYLLAFLTYCKHVVWREQNDKRCWSALIGAIVLSIAAVLCKETAATSLVLCALYDVIRATNGYRDKVSLIVCLAYFVLLLFHTKLFPNADEYHSHTFNLISFFLFCFLHTKSNFTASHAIAQHHWSCDRCDSSFAFIAAAFGNRIFYR